MRIDKVILKVTNINKMADYYKNVLGMFELKRDKEQIELGTKTHTLIILKTDKSIKLKKAEEANLYHIAYLLPDRKSLGNFLRHIMELKVEGVGAGDHLVSEAIYLNDPEGNGIEVYADRNKEEWKYNDSGDVIMDTLELNANELYLLSEDNLFKIPDGTVIGHVHMQGYNIPEIKEFYEKKLLLKKTSTLPNAVFLSYDGYHHHFAFNHWDGRVSEPGKESSTGLETIVFELDKEKYEKILNNFQISDRLEKEENYFIVKDLNNTKLKISRKL